MVFNRTIHSLLVLIRNVFAFAYFHENVILFKTKKMIHSMHFVRIQICLNFREIDLDPQLYSSRTIRRNIFPSGLFL